MNGIDLDNDEIGSDCIGSLYKNIDEMWDLELNPESHCEDRVVQKIGSYDQWYSKQAEYWEKTESTVDGVLGGFGKLHTPDMIDSKKFVALLHDKHQLQYGRVMDCGAGVGRITQELLLKFFSIVDINDQNPKYVDACKEKFQNDKRVQLYIAEGMQKLNFTQKYECIWVQWVCNYITDIDFVPFLQRCAAALSENGIIVIKENIATRGFVVDKDDISVTRSDNLFMKLFEKAGLQIIETQIQSNFPKELYKVKSYALRSKQKPIVEEIKVESEIQQE